MKITAPNSKVKRENKRRRASNEGNRTNGIVKNEDDLGASGDEAAEILDQTRAGKRLLGAISPSPDQQQQQQPLQPPQIKIEQQQQYHFEQLAANPSFATTPRKVYESDMASPKVILTTPTTRSTQLSAGNLVEPNSIWSTFTTTGYTSPGGWGSPSGFTSPSKLFSPSFITTSGMISLNSPNYKKEMTPLASKNNEDSILEGANILMNITPQSHSLDAKAAELMFGHQQNVKTETETEPSLPSLSDEYPDSLSNIHTPSSEGRTKRKVMNLSVQIPSTGISFGASEQQQQQQQQKARVSAASGSGGQGRAASSSPRQLAEAND
jgi:hypothetical protein